MITMVNGYVCYNCTDADYAKKGINPAHPNRDDPLSRQAKSQNEIAALGKSENTPAVILSGALSKPDGVSGSSSLSSSDATNLSSSYAATTGTNLKLSV